MCADKKEKILDKLAQQFAELFVAQVDDINEDDKQKNEKRNKH